MSNFGMSSKQEEGKLYTLTNRNQMQIAVTDYGAALVKVIVPDREGNMLDVVLGYDDVAGYEASDTYFGATVGRVANRIGGGEFELNGVRYALTQNDNRNTLHGGRDFYNKRIWNVEESAEDHLTFFLHSPDGDQGFPGAADIRVTYVLTEDNEVKIQYEVTTQADTIVNLTNHSYFNLNGHDSGDVLGQVVTIEADAFTRADKESIPTGEIVDVSGTPMDFRSGKEIGAEIEEPYEALIFGAGYDHNWVLSGSGYRKAASMDSAKTGIHMDVYTDLPGMQFYTGNFIEHERGKDGAVYQRRQGACFETQYFPDAVHKEQFEGPVVKAGEKFCTTTAYRFGICKDR